jgi:tetratricopeptide (TPR) repeat protein
MSEAADARLAHKAKALFAHGNDAAMKNNLDYAIDLYGQALKLDPGNLTFRQALRVAERRRFNNEPSKVGMLTGARLQPIRMRARSEKGKGNAERALEICEEAFRLNPWDVGTARDAADAAEALGWKPLACWLMESVIVQAGDDKDYLKQLAHVYEWTEQWAKAIACWERVRKLNPYDEQAKRQINALSASATIARSGYSETYNKEPDAPSGPQINVAGLDDLKVKSESPEVRMLREIEEEPDRPRPYLELADHYRSLNKLDEAEKVLARARKALPDDELLRSTHADIQLARLKRAIEHWDKKAALDPDDAEAREKLQALREKLVAYELNELKHRVKLQPTDAQLRLRYGSALAQAGRHDEAIAEFQQARSDPDLKVEALHLSGQSFEAKGLPKLAERSYLEALKLADAESDHALVLALHYRLGRVAESQGDRAGAEEHYNEVAATDYTYLDVAERLRALNQGR